METWVNIISAWVAVCLAFTLSIVYVLRRIRRNKPGSRFKSWDRSLRKHHKTIGILLILVGLAHGIYSSDTLVSLNIGTMTWAISILLGISFYLRKHLGIRKSWTNIHRTLTAVFLFSICVHLVDINNIVIDDIARGSRTGAIVLEEPQIYRDGAFRGEATGFRPGLVVEVEIRGDRIISVGVISHNEVGARFWGTPVREIPGRIVEDQSTEVDVISGATRTSNGIIRAVEDALRKAVGTERGYRLGSIISRSPSPSVAKLTTVKLSTRPGKTVTQGAASKY